MRHLRLGATPPPSLRVTPDVHLPAPRSITDAEANLGESEVREALLAKANFFVKIGDKARQVNARGASAPLSHAASPDSSQPAAEAALEATEKKVSAQGESVLAPERVHSHTPCSPTDGGCGPQDGPRLHGADAAPHLHRLARREA